MKPGRAVVCLVALGIFIMVVPSRAPTIRAAVICLFYFMGIIIYRKINPYNALALAAMIILLFRPMEIFNVGFQLSFMTVLGILFFAGKINTFLLNLSGYGFLSIQPFKGFVGYTVNILSIGLAAWLGGTPILLYNFYTITPLTCVWTVIAFPFVGIILILGLLKILLSFLLPTASVLLGFIVTGLADALIWIVKFLAELEISGILIGSVGLGFVIFCYLFLFFARFGSFRPAWIKKVICILAVIGVIFFLGARKYKNTKRDNLQLTVLSIGHGQCVFAGLPGRANLIFDAGSLSMSDIGSKVVVPFLARRGINKIDAIFVSHNNIDHLNGIPEIVKTLKVAAIYAPYPALKKARPASMLKYLEKFIESEDKKLRPIPAKIEFSESAKITVLWPSDDIGDINKIGDNDISQVTLIEFAGVKILLCSDIEQFGQKQLLKKYPQLKADILLLPHHGSKKTLTPDFISRLNPDIQIVSCGWKDYQRQPDSSKKILFTPLTGAVTITVGKNGSIKTETWSNRP